MDFLSAQFFISLFSIIIIDLVLAGDNAIVIAMAARNLPAQHQKKVIVWGTLGAVVIRVVATLLVVYLLQIPGLHLVGGLVLVWIALKLLMEKKEDHHIEAGTTIWKAVSTIIVADAAMGLDNVLAVAAAAHGDIWLVIVGLLISIPIMVYGSTLVIKLMDRFPWIIYLGSGILAWTASKMIFEEGFIKTALAEISFIKWVFMVVITAGVLFAGKLYRQKHSGDNDDMKKTRLEGA